MATSVETATMSGATTTTGATMTAAQVSAYGEKAPAISMSTSCPKPSIIPGKKQLLVRVLACSTAAGDVHMLSGRVSTVVKPPSFPYIPGKDVCGIVAEADEGSTFKVGDCVVGSRDMAAYGGMAQYIILEERRTCVKPSSVDVLQAASCPDSSVTALKTLDAAKIKEGERVLVLGGSGGVGSSVVQLVRGASPSLLASTSTQEQMLKALGADQVIDYRTQDWWEVEEFAAKPFDVIIDCVGGGGHYDKARKVLKNKREGGRFVAVVGDEPKPLAKNYLQLVGFALRMMRRPLLTALNPWVPSYVIIMSSIEAEPLSRVLDKMASGQLRVVLDAASPLPFTAEGVKQAFEIQAGGHAHGKVVVRVAEQ